MGATASLALLVAAAATAVRCHNKFLVEAGILFSVCGPRLLATCTCMRCCRCAAIGCHCCAVPPLAVPPPMQKMVGDRPFGRMGLRTGDKYQIPNNKIRLPARIKSRSDVLRFRLPHDFFARKFTHIRKLAEERNSYAPFERFIG